MTTAATIRLLALSAIMTASASAGAQPHDHHPPTHQSHSPQAHSQHNPQTHPSHDRPAHPQHNPQIEAAVVAATKPPALPARARPPRAVAGRVVTPGTHTLPLRSDNGVRVGHLIAEEVDHEFAPGLRAKVWGYNGVTPGPTIEATEGDRLRILVENRLPEATSVHWHGLILPNGMDGVAGLTQPAIPPGETFVYEFTLTRAGTFMYHPHYDEMTQIGLGMAGMFIVHPKRESGARVDHDFALLTHEWKLPVGASRPDPTEMSDFNVLTFNSRAFPATQALEVKRGDRVRIRIGNLSPTDHHPIHLHGLAFRVTATDGGFIPKSAQIPETTVLVPVGSVRVIEFVADETGDWPIHCHMTHHVMTQMGHGQPNLLGTNASRLTNSLARAVPGGMVMGTTGMGGMEDMQMPVPANSTPMRGAAGPFGTIDMGGMFTILKVRDRGDGSRWHRHPKATIAHPLRP